MILDKYIKTTLLLEKNISMRIEMGHTRESKCNKCKLLTEKYLDIGWSEFEFFPDFK